MAHAPQREPPRDVRLQRLGVVAGLRGGGQGGGGGGGSGGALPWRVPGLVVGGGGVAAAAGLAGCIAAEKS